MRAVNGNAKKVLETLTEGLTEENRHRKVDNTNGAYMPVVVEFVEDTRLGPTFSVAHYFEQNGDLMADPEMVFLKATTTGDFYPLHVKMDALGSFRRGYVISPDGKSDRINKREQADQAVFAGTWMQNIKHQQNLGAKKAA